MIYAVLFTATHIVAFLLGRLYGANEAKNIIMKILKDRGII